MSETIYTAEPELRHPARFLGAARGDLSHTAAVAWHLFRRNVRSRYRRSWLGYAWLLLPTIAMTLVWVFIQSRRILALAPTDVPYPIHVLAGMTLWQTFVDAWNVPLQQLGAGRQLVTRSRVPLEALVLAGVLETLLNCAARLVVLAVLLPVYDVPFGVNLLLAPIGIAALAVLGLALGVLLAPLGMLYEDVSRAVLMVSGLWFFLTPVVYRATPERIVRFNPVTPLLETTRAWLTASAPAADGFVPVTVLAFVLLIVASLLLRLARPHIVERLG